MPDLWDNFPDAPQREPLRVTVNPRGQEDAWGQFPDAPAAVAAELSNITRTALKPQVSRGRALYEGVLSGAGANFRDEILGASEASGLPGWLGGLRTPVGAARLAYEAVAGPGEATETYGRTVRDIRSVQKAAEEQYPGTTIAGNIAGAVMLPVGAALQVATLPARIGRSAAVGAGYGGLAGAGEGESIIDRATRATAGAALGGVVGAVAPPIIEGAIQGGRALGQPIASALRGAFRPDDEAASRVVSALRRDIAADPGAATRLTAAEFAAAPEARVMDAGGDLTRRLADVAGTVSPEGRVALNQAINPRFEGQSTRVTQWLNYRFAFPNADAQREALEESARAVNRVNYGRAMRAPQAQAIWDEGLEQIVQAPVVQEAIRGATRTGANRAAIDGFTPVRNPFVLDPATGRMTLATDAQGNRALPNLQFWDIVKRNLDDRISALQRSGERSAARDAIQLRSYLVERLDDLVPAYREARGGAAAFFGAENALEAGQRFVSENFAAPATRRALARMSDNERRLFQDGFVSRFIETVDRTGDRRSILNMIGNSPAAREKLEIALGRNGWRELEAMMRVEGIMDFARSAVQGNSWTARRLYDLGLVGGAGIGGSGIYNQDASQMTTAAVIAALSSGGKKLDQRVMRRVADMLVSDDPAVLRRGMRIVAGNERMMNALRATDRRIAAAGAEQVPSGAFPQFGAVPGRTDSEQPRR